MMPVFRNAKQLFEEGGPGAFSQFDYRDGQMVQVVECVSVDPGFRLYHNRILFGVEITLEITREDGKKVRTNFLIPSHERVRARSKHMPHQGQRERTRRIVGSFAGFRRTMNGGDL